MENLEVIVSEGVKITGDNAGVIGVNFLKYFFIEIDYQSKLIELSRQQSENNIDFSPFSPENAKGNEPVLFSDFNTECEKKE